MIKGKIEKPLMPQILCDEFISVIDEKEMTFGDYKGRSYKMPKTNISQEMFNAIYAEFDNTLWQTVTDPDTEKMELWLFIADEYKGEKVFETCEQEDKESADDCCGFCSPTTEEFNVSAFVEHLFDRHSIKDIETAVAIMKERLANAICIDLIAGVLEKLEDIYKMLDEDFEGFRLVKDGSELSIHGNFKSIGEREIYNYHDMSKIESIEPIILRIAAFMALPTE